MVKIYNYADLKDESLEENRLIEIENRLVEIEQTQNTIFSNLEDKGGFDKVYNDNKKTIINLDNEKNYLQHLQARINRYNVKVGEGVTVNLYSDSNAYTIIKRTKNTITIQRDKAILSKDFKPDFSVGGFAAHCNNQNEQLYTYEKDNNGVIEVAHWSNKNGCYMVSKCLTIRNGRHEFYDYNF